MLNKSFLSLTSGMAVLLLLLMSQMCQAHTLHGNSTLDKIARTKTLALGYQEDAFPFSYIEAQHPTGYSIDICNKIVDAIKVKLNIKDLKVRWVKSSTASQFVLLKNHVTDFVCIPAFYSDSRHQKAEFSQPYFFSRTRFLTRKNNHTDTIDNLAGHSVLVKSGTIYVEQIHNINRVNDLNLNIELDNNNIAAFDDVETGELPALVSSSIFLRGMIAQSNNPDDFEISDEALSPPIPAGFLLPLNDSEFKNFMDSTMQALFASNDFIAIYQRWFQSPIPPKAINLNIPMSAELKALTTSTSPYVY